MILWSIIFIQSSNIIFSLPQRIKVFLDLLILFLCLLLTLNFFILRIWIWHYILSLPNFFLIFTKEPETPQPNWHRCNSTDKFIFFLFFIDCRNNLAKTAIFNFGHWNRTLQDFRHHTGWTFCNWSSGAIDKRFLW